MECVNMSKSEEMQRLEKDIRNSESLRRKWEETIKEIADKKIAKSDGEVLEMAAKKLGYNIRKEELEKKTADGEEIDEDDLKNVTGGGDFWCFTIRACYAVLLHEDTKEPTACWSDYYCKKFSKRCQSVNYK